MDAAASQVKDYLKPRATTAEATDMVTQATAAPRGSRRRIFGEPGWIALLPYLLLAPTVFLVLAVARLPADRGGADEHGVLPVRQPRCVTSGSTTTSRPCTTPPSSVRVVTTLEVRRPRRDPGDGARPGLALLCAQRGALHPRGPRLADPADDRDAGRRRHRLPADLRLGRRARRHAGPLRRPGPARDPRPAERRLRRSGVPGRLGVDAADVPHPAGGHPVAAGGAVRGRAGGRRGGVAHVRRPHAADAAADDPGRRRPCAPSTR